MNQSLTRTVVSIFEHNYVRSLTRREDKRGNTAYCYLRSGEIRRRKSKLFQALLSKAFREIVQPFYLKMNSKFNG